VTAVSFDPVARSDVSRPLLWLLGGTVAAAAHAGAVAWALRQPHEPPPETPASAVVLLELAPVPTAPPAVEDQLAPDPMDAPDLTSPPLPEATPLEPAPMPPTATPLEPPPVEAPPLPTVAAELPAETPVEPRPLARPETLRVARPPEPERAPDRPQPEAPSRPAVASRVQAQPAPQVAAPETLRGSGPTVSPAKWQSRLMAHLERRKRYPAAARRRGEQGTAHVRFSIDGAGNVLSAQLARSSGSAELDAAVVALVQRASPVPAPPPGAPHTITAPVRFSLR
jgi:protein TonB